MQNYSTRGEKIYEFYVPLAYWRGSKFAIASSFDLSVFCDLVALSLSGGVFSFAEAGDSS